MSTEKTQVVEKAKHTPGPWTVQVDAHYRGRIKAGELWLATAWTVTREGNDSPALPAIANARLMSAAPDLLEACKQIVAADADSIEDCGTPDNHTTRHVCMVCGASYGCDDTCPMNLLRAAIALAQGGVA